MAGICDLELFPYQDFLFITLELRVGGWAQPAKGAAALSSSRVTFGASGFTTAEDGGSILQTPRLSSCRKYVTLWVCLLRMLLEGSLLDEGETKTAI